MSASVENLVLEADSLGLGAVWFGIAPLKERIEAVRTVLSMPEIWMLSRKRQIAHLP